MNATVAKWGNSLGLRIPKAFAQALSLDERSEVSVAIEDGALVVRPLRVAATFQLAQLIDRITDENVHAETDTGGSALGNEF